jgi:hypothetical protein
MFDLHVVQALYGDCLLLEYGDERQPHFLLVDGGPATVYLEHLRPLLLAIAGRGGRLDQVVLTHADDDHVIGLVDLFAELRLGQTQGQASLIPVDAVWMNSFAFDAAVAPSLAHIVIPNLPQPAAAAVDDAEPGIRTSPPAPLRPLAAVEDAEHLAPLYGVAEGMDMRELLARLQLPVNHGFPGDLVTLDAAPPELALHGLNITLVGPAKANIDRLRREWQAWLAAHRPPEGAQALPDAAENYDRKISPDQSIPNRSSIMFVAEYGGRRVLLTGDGRGSDVVRGLVRRGLMAKDGVYHVDVMKVPHHGSARNASRKFFSQVTADVYVLSANGKDGNPDMPTLAWMVQAIKEQRRTARIVATNPTPTLVQMTQEFPPALYGYTLEVLEAGQHAFTVRG